MMPFRLIFFDLVYVEEHSRGDGVTDATTVVGLSPFLYL